MEHRHLNHSLYSLAAIDDVIARGGMDDWLDLREAMDRDASLLPKVQRICEAKIHDPYEQRYHFWKNYVDEKLASA